jgi:hypothetical protein
LHKTRAQEDEIFSQYELRNPGRAILRDGIPDPETYWQPDNLRLLFVLKEGNDPTGKWSLEDDLRDFVASGAKYKSWANLACWTAFARSVSFDLTSRIDQQWRADQLRHSAFVNLKKVPGGATADNPAVLDFALLHGDLLRQQISLYDPHLTIACGSNTFHVLETVFEGTREKSENVFFYLKHQTLGTVIDFYHPQARIRGGAQSFLDMLRINLAYHFPEKYS